MDVLVIAAHPDDEVLGMGGTIAKRARRGDQICLLMLTEGCSSQYGESSEMIANKKAAAKAAAKILGIDSIVFADLPDMKLDTVRHVDLNAVIEECIRDTKPEVVYTLYPDVNKDHRLVFDSTMVAVRPLPKCRVKEVLAYAPSSSYEWSAPISHPPFTPNVFVNISETLEAKTQAFACYVSELREYPHPRSPEALRIYSRRTGIAVGCDAAEGFVLIRKLED